MLGLGCVACCCVCSGQQCIVTVRHLYLRACACACASVCGRVGRWGNTESPWGASPSPITRTHRELRWDREWAANVTRAQARKIYVASSKIYRRKLLKDEMLAMDLSGKNSALHETNKQNNIPIIITYWTRPCWILCNTIDAFLRSFQNGFSLSPFFFEGPLRLVAGATNLASESTKRRINSGSMWLRHTRGGERCMCSKPGSVCVEAWDTRRLRDSFNSRAALTGSNNLW